MEAAAEATEAAAEAAATRWQLSGCMQDLEAVTTSLQERLTRCNDADGTSGEPARRSLDLAASADMSAADAPTGGEHGCCHLGSPASSRDGSLASSLDGALDGGSPGASRASAGLLLREGEPRGDGRDLAAEIRSPVSATLATAALAAAVLAEKVAPTDVRGGSALTAKVRKRCGECHTTTSTRQGMVSPSFMALCLI